MFIKKMLLTYFLFKQLLYKTLKLFIKTTCLNSCKLTRLLFLESKRAFRQILLCDLNDKVNKARQKHYNTMATVLLWFYMRKIRMTRYNHIKYLVYSRPLTRNISSFYSLINNPTHILWIRNNLFHLSC